MANHVSHAALPYPIKGARYSVLIPYLDADGDPTAPTTPDTEISEDNAAATDAAEEASATSGMDGMALLTLTGAETDCSTLALNAKVASGPKATLMTLFPRVLASISTGTLAAGSASGGTLNPILPFDLTGCFIKTTGGTGGGGTGGANNQARKIVTYTAAGVFTVEPNFETAVSTDTTYSILLPEGVTFGMLKAQAGGVHGTLSGTHSSTTADLGTSAPTVDIAGQTLWFPSHGISVVIDSYNTGTGVATFSPATAVTLANGNPWVLVPTPAPSTGAPPTVLVSVGTGTGQINASSGKVPATIAVGDIADNAITAAKIAADTITAAKIADGAIDAGAFAADAITAAKIASDVTTELQNGLATAANLATVAGYLDTEIAAILALLDDPRTEPGQGAPPVNPDLATKIDYLYKAWRNRSTVTASEYALYADNGTTKDHEAAISDNGTTFDRAEVTTGA